MEESIIASGSESSTRVFIELPPLHPGEVLVPPLTTSPMPLSHQPPCSDLVPDAFTNVPYWLPSLRAVTLAQLWGFVLFLVAGPVAALATLAMVEALDYCLQTLQRAIIPQPYVGFVILPIVLPAVIYVSDRFFVGIANSGIPKTVMSLRLVGTKPKRVPTSLWDDIWNGGVFEGHLSLRMAVGKFFLTIIAIFAGVSCGPEGPMVQTASAIVLAFQKAANLPFFYPQAAIMAGSAIAIGTIFRAPIGGIVFAIEEIGGQFEHFGLRISVVSLVSIAGLVISQIPGQQDVYFGQGIAPYTLQEWGAVPICGILLGILGGSFARIVIEGQKWRKRHPALVARYYLVFAFLMGVFIVLLAAWTDGSVYGAGDETAREILDGARVDDFTENLTYYLYGPFKYLSTLFSALTGVSGGLFVPSLAAGVGWGRLFTFLCPFASKEIIVIFSMIAYFSGLTQGPVTTWVIAYEMFRFDWQHLLPALAVATVASFASKLVCPYPFYMYAVRVANQPVPAK